MRGTPSPNVIILMGVAGAGKTAVGEALADALGWRFIEGDRYHSQANVDKMSRGVPLTDADRRPWLVTLRDAIADVARRGEHAVLACSALRHEYREILRGGADPPDVLRFVYLDAPPAVLAERLARRQHHFAPPELLPSQLETLEEPHDALWVDATKPIAEIVDRVTAAFHLARRNDE